MSLPRLVTSISTAATVREAVQELVDGLRREAGTLPVAGGLVYATIDHDPMALQDALAGALPGVPLAGATSCQGVGVSSGFLAGPAVAALWFLGEGVSFGTALQARGGDGRVPGEALAKEAARGSVPGRRARIAILHSTPGGEESLVGDVGRVLSPEVFIGGSAADNDLSGRWAVWTDRAVAKDGAVLAVCDWPGQLSSGYQGGFLTTPRQGTVTAAAGRVIHRIDGRPAAEVYNEWTGGAIASALDGGSVLSRTTLAPLGVRRRGADDATRVVAHPESVGPSRTLAVFVEVSEGDEVVLLRGTTQALVGHAQRVADWSLGVGGLTGDELAGALLVYCAGCMLTIGGEATRMLERFRGAVGEKPFVAFFAFGEQGCLLPGTPMHGNLMTSLLALGTKAR